MVFCQFVQPDILNFCISLYIPYVGVGIDVDLPSFFVDRLKQIRARGYCRISSVRGNGGDSVTHYANWYRRANLKTRGLLIYHINILWENCEGRGNLNDRPASFSGIFKFLCSFY